jgi:hypothetical protein
MLNKLLLPRLKAKFPEQDIRVSADTPPVITIKAISADFGDIEIRDDEEEVTICYGRLTHEHIGVMYENVGTAAWAEDIVSAVVETLEGVIAERTEIWVEPDRASGAQDRGTRSGEVFVWSGRKVNP